MINLIGLLIVTFGFIVPFITELSSLPYICFLSGFLLLLRPNQWIPSMEGWAEGGRLGLLANAVGMIILMLFGLFLVGLSRNTTHIEYLAIQTLSRLVSPVASLADTFVPPPRIELSDGSVGMSFHHVRTATTDFLDIFVYLCLGATAWILFKLKPQKSGGGYS